MAIDTKLSALEIDSWLFELNEDGWAAFERRLEVGEQSRAEQSEAGQSDSQEFSTKSRRVRINLRGIQRFL